MTALRRVWQAHERLPAGLRLPLLAPATLVIVIFLGVTFTIPPGPLCDEGMILFMEGGCDYGDSNIFFFSKLGTMIALNLAFIVAWRAARAGRAVEPPAFLPHFIAAALLAWLNRSGGHCDTYYAHPNGSIGQMVVELAAYAFLGLAIVRAWAAGGSAWRLPLALAGWTLAYVLAFYAALAVTFHWTWLHTLLVTGLLLLAGLVVGRRVALRA